MEVGHLRLHAGEVELLPFDGHLVNLHLSSTPHYLVQHRNEHKHEGFKNPGVVDVIPAGTPAYFRMGAASEHTSMLLMDRFIRRVAQETGADPDAFEIAPFFNTPDPSIERTGLLLLSEMKTQGLGGRTLRRVAGPRAGAARPAQLLLAGRRFQAKDRERRRRL